MNSSKKRLFYVSDDWKKSISVTISELQEGLVSGKHTIQTLAWTEGMTNWLPLSDSHWKKFDIGFPSLPPPLPQSKGCMDCGTTDTKLEFHKTTIYSHYAIGKVGKYLQDIGRIDVYEYFKAKLNQISKSFESIGLSNSHQTEQNLEVIEDNEEFDTIIEDSTYYLVENYFTCFNCMSKHEEMKEQIESYEMDKVDVEENIETSYCSSLSKENNKFRTKTDSNMTFAQGATVGFIANQIRETKEAVNDIQEDVSDIQEDVSDIQSEASDNPGADFSGFF